MFKYRAIVFDIDGTAVDNRMDAMPSARLVAAVTAAKEQTYLIAATGRPYVYAKPIIDALGLTAPCIFSGGTNIIEPATGRVIARTMIPASAIPLIVDIITPTPYSVILDDEPKDSVRGGGAIKANIDIIFIENVEPRHVAGLQASFDKIAGITAASVPAWGTGFTFTITSSLATKEHAIAQVLKRLGVDREASIGVGDGGNDVHLFAAVGLKVAMGNAVTTLKAAADMLTAEVNQEGLAQVIEEYGFKK